MPRKRKAPGAKGRLRSKVLLNIIENANIRFNSAREFHFSSEDPRRDEALEHFERAVEEAGFSVDDPNHGWALAAALFFSLLGTRSGKRPSRPGRKPSEEALLQDWIVMHGIIKARRAGDRRSERDIIGDIAKENGWPTTDRAISTRRRRQYQLRAPNSRTFQRTVDLVALQLREGWVVVSDDEYGACLAPPDDGVSGESDKNTI